MKIAVLSDIHANIQALQAVLHDCDGQNVRRFWMLGDYIDYGGNPLEVMQELKNMDVEHRIAGNHDGCLYISSVRSSATPHGKKAYEYTKQVVMGNRPAFRMLEEIADKPVMYLAQKKILLVHGTPEDPYWGKFLPGMDADPLFTDMERMDVRTMFVGHSHVGFLLTKAGRRIVNPGSVGQPRDGYPQASYAIVEEDSVTFRRVNYDIDGAADAIRSRNLPEYLWKRLYEGI